MDTSIILPNQLPVEQDGDKIMIPMEELFGQPPKEPNLIQDNIIDFSGFNNPDNNNLISIDASAFDIQGDPDAQNDDIDLDDDTSYNMGGSQFAESKKAKKSASAPKLTKKKLEPKQTKKEKAQALKKAKAAEAKKTASKAAESKNQRFMQSYLDDMEQTKKQN